MSVEDAAREHMHSCIDKLGTSHPLTIEASQLLDIIIVKEMKEINYGRKEKIS